MVWGVVLTALKATKSFVYDNVKEYVGYIGSCSNNLGALNNSLSDVCNKKGDIEKKVKEGNDKLEEITREAASWLKDARILTKDEKLKGLMYKDIETAKFVVKLMGNKYLKRRIREESEMQQLVLKVMRKLKEEVDKSEEEMRKILEVDYKYVAEVVVEVMKDTIDEFRKLMKEDRKMAVIAIRTLKDSDLDKLTKGDNEIEEIVREARYSSDEDLWPNREDDESGALQPLLIEIPEMGVNENILKKAAKKLFTPLACLVTPLGKLMDDGDFKKAVPHAVDVKLALEVIDGLFIRDPGSNNEMDDPTKQDNRGCCCCSPLSLCSYYQGRYLISKAAESVVQHIQNELIGKCPRDPVTLRKNPQDLKPIPSQFLGGLDSRTQLLHQVLEKLNDDQVNSIGLFGMGGIGKTTLAKEVSNRVKDTFTVKVMVEVSNAPDIVRIQAAIAESVDLPLNDVSNVGQRAIRLYNRLISEKEKKILIVLDNVWKKLNLDEIGIPDTCKLLFTTRDREVCRVMDVRDVNILEVGVMNTNEARELFKSQAGNQADVREYKSLVERLLNKCGGLPLAIVAIANSLKEKDLSSWVKFANDLEKPISSQRSGGDYHDIFTVLNTSYKFIQPVEKRIFFLLACLSPPGSSVSIESLMRYGMGLNLFENVNNLSEAMEEVVTWGNKLKLASMLLEGDVKGDVKIHDVVRDVAISYAAEAEEHKFMVDEFPGWRDDETMNKYTAVSLTNGYSRLSGVEACKLQILILKGDLTPEFNDDFFSGMLNLRVLAVSNMNFQPSLPDSMRSLKKLRTLCIEVCKLGNIEVVGELVNLLVLSLRGSSMDNIPNIIGNLRKLRLLDVGECTSSTLTLIPTSVLNKLFTLEGLYMYNMRQLVLEMKSEYEEADGIVNIKLPYLNALEMKEGHMKELPFDGQTFENLDKFRISLGSYDVTPGTDFQNFCCSLHLEGIDASGFVKRSCHKLLLKKAEYLKMEHSRNFEGVVPLLDKEGFRCLRSLHLYRCDDIKFIVDGRTMHNMIVFPCLQSLTLQSLKGLEKICNGDISPRSFSNLQTIKLFGSDELRYGLPLVPRSLKEIQVTWCCKLEFIFIEDEEVLPTELRFLKTLELGHLLSLSSLVGPKEFSNSYDALRGPRPFFGGKIELPSLEFFKMRSCENVVRLWSTENPSGFQNLKEIIIDDCRKLLSIGSPSVFSNLVQLEISSIVSCYDMHEFMHHHEIEESEIGEHSIVFSQLKSLKLEKLHNLESFYGGRSKLEFPKLKTLILDSLKSMKMFAKLGNSSALFNKKLDFPCLEELKVIRVNDEVTGLWDKQSWTKKSNPAPMLRQLELGCSAGLRQIPSIVLENISSLKLTDFHFQEDDVVFSSSNFGDKGGFVGIYSQLPNLEGLKVQGSASLKELFEEEDSEYLRELFGERDYNSVDDALTLFCGQFKTLELMSLPSLNPVPLHLFKSIASLTLYALEWNYVISADVLTDSLHQLQFLSIEYCPKMEALVMNTGSQIKFPNLKQLQLQHLNSLIGISSMPDNEAALLLLPSLESLEITSCGMLDHFWSSSISAPRLEDVDIRYCNNLQHFLVGNPEDTIELPSLQKVTFRPCINLESITTGSLTAPKLRKVELGYCRKMECFIPGNQNHDGHLQLPSLEVVFIWNCPNLHTFSRRRLVAPKLTEIKYNGQVCSMLPFHDLNHFLAKEVHQG